MQIVDLSASGLNIDFTSSSATAEQIRNAAIALRDVMKLTNLQYAQQTGMFQARSPQIWNATSATTTSLTPSCRSC
nr:Uncharacterised protein [Klebsiella pneumoniae]